MAEIISKDKRYIELSYKIQDEEKDKEIMKLITNEVVSNKLHCEFGEDDNTLRYVRISGLNSEIVSNVYTRIKELLN